MILFRPILFLFFSIFGSASYGQINLRKLDSFSKTIDSSAKAKEKWQDSFNKVQDSIYQTSVASKDGPMKENEKSAAKKRQKVIVRIIIGALFCIGLITGFIMRTKPKS